ncbi:MAG: hypothetical protein KJ042_11100 [Deltaproteobacteria bacterium]|nr:hypothetical protein [Deltaproteobacteria bacterium]
MALTTLRNRIAGNLVDLATHSGTPSLSGITKVCFWVMADDAADGDIFHFIKSGGNWGSVQNGGVGTGTKDTLVFVVTRATYLALWQYCDPPQESSFNTTFGNARTAKKLSEYGYNNSGAAYPIQEGVWILWKA